MTNSNAVKYGGIAAVSLLGLYLLFKTTNTAMDPKVQSAVSTAYEYPAALSDIIIKGKRYDTKREVQEGGSRKHNNKHRNKYIKRRSVKNKK
jgi:hypothetical protein